VAAWLDLETAEPRDWLQDWLPGTPQVPQKDLFLERLQRQLVEQLLETPVVPQRDWLLERLVGTLRELPLGMPLERLRGQLLGRPRMQVDSVPAGHKLAQRKAAMSSFLHQHIARSKALCL